LWIAVSGSRPATVHGVVFDILKPGVAAARRDWATPGPNARRPLRIADRRRRVTMGRAIASGLHGIGVR